ncbi:STAS domain-containing protein [Halobacillus karajensis]|uniref:Stressosome protein RsbRD n=1 Tax=Halobacillus karajensis TaxID=195088 RepID=A0A024P8B6_9BACI|nr:STAS domain-containing protein [Halobacillus karajensis]CDQ20169.1 Stressosome protein RsbRD [Halobacillus karajensis]CDQ25170.1 Stressosome protein RsbRD [Halobacillus karajensis]CDQ28469.1 Stressosome protein RsbRD [Halobacillus karajensis]
MEQTYEYSNQLKGFFEKNNQNFEQILLSEAVNVKDKIHEILTVGNIDLVNNAHTLVYYIIDGEDEALRKFAKQEGIAWATHSIDLSFKLEWVQAIRRSLWRLIEKFYEMNENKKIRDFFQLESAINDRVDEFLNSFFITYSTYKDSLLSAQQELVKNLSVPIIPIGSSICILPLIGAMDNNRIEILKDKVLTKVSDLSIETLIMDLSGIATMDKESTIELTKVIDGISMMGCKTVITGLRKETVREVTNLGIQFNQQTETLATLQQALSEYFFPHFNQ